MKPQLQTVSNRRPTMRESFPSTTMTPLRDALEDAADALGLRLDDLA